MERAPKRPRDADADDSDDSTSIATDDCASDDSEVSSYTLWNRAISAESEKQQFNVKITLKQIIANVAGLAPDFSTRDWILACARVTDLCTKILRIIRDIKDERRREVRRNVELEAQKIRDASVVVRESEGICDEGFCRSFLQTLIPRIGVHGKGWLLTSEEYETQVREYPQMLRISVAKADGRLACDQWYTRIGRSIENKVKLPYVMTLLETHLTSHFSETQNPISKNKISSLYEKKHPNSTF